MKRPELKHYQTKAFHHFDMESYAKDLNNYIDYLEQETKAENLPISDVSEWVAVSEQLPPNETKEYEVCRDGNVEFDVWYYREGKGYWYNYLGITHWKEKPEPPFC